MPVRPGATSAIRSARGWHNSANVSRIISVPCWCERAVLYSAIRLSSRACLLGLRRLRAAADSSRPRRSRTTRGASSSSTSTTQARSTPTSCTRSSRRSARGSRGARWCARAPFGARRLGERSAAAGRGGGAGQSTRASGARAIPRHPSMQSDDAGRHVSMWGVVPLCACVCRCARCAPSSAKSTWTRAARLSSTSSSRRLRVVVKAHDSHTTHHLFDRRDRVQRVPARHEAPDRGRASVVRDGAGARAGRGGGRHAQPARWAGRRLERGRAQRGEGWWLRLRVPA